MDIYSYDLFKNTEDSIVFNQKKNIEIISDIKDSLNYSNKFASDKIVTKNISHFEQEFICSNSHTITYNHECEVVAYSLTQPCSNSSIRLLNLKSFQSSLLANSSGNLSIFIISQPLPALVSIDDEGSLNYFENDSSEWKKKFFLDINVKSEKILYSYLIVDENCLLFWIVNEKLYLLNLTEMNKNECASQLHSAIKIEETLTKPIIAVCSLEIGTKIFLFLLNAEGSVDIYNVTNENGDYSLKMVQNFENDDSTVGSLEVFINSAQNCLTFLIGSRNNRLINFLTVAYSGESFVKVSAQRFEVKPSIGKNDGEVKDFSLIIPQLQLTTECPSKPSDERFIILSDIRRSVIYSLYLTCDNDDWCIRSFSKASILQPAIFLYYKDYAKVKKEINLETSQEAIYHLNFLLLTPKSLLSATLTHDVKCPAVVNTIEEVNKSPPPVTKVTVNMLEKENIIPASLLMAPNESCKKPEILNQPISIPPKGPIDTILELLEPKKPVVKVSVSNVEKPPTEPVLVVDDSKDVLSKLTDQMQFLAQKLTMLSDKMQSIDANLSKIRMDNQKLMESNHKIETMAKTKATSNDLESKDIENLMRLHLDSYTEKLESVLSHQNALIINNLNVKLKEAKTAQTCDKNILENKITSLVGSAMENLQSEMVKSFDHTGDKIHSSLSSKLSTSLTTSIDKTLNNSMRDLFSKKLLPLLEKTFQEVAQEICQISKVSFDNFYQTQFEKFVQNNRSVLFEKSVEILDEFSKDLQPPKVDMARIANEAQKHILNEQPLKALKIALQCGNDQFLVDLCADVDPKFMFKNKDEIDQNSLTILVTKLSDDLVTDFDVKISYIFEAISNMDKSSLRSIQKIHSKCDELIASGSLKSKDHVQKIEILQILLDKC